LDVHVPDPIITRAIGRGEKGPEANAVLADSLGLALLVVLEKLEPAERLAFVLHDVFAMPFEEIAPVVDRSVVATRQLASRARRRVQGEAPASDADLRKQRRVVDAFLAAVQDGDFEGLVASWIRISCCGLTVERSRACRASCVGLRRLSRKPRRSRRSRCPIRWSS
jgi:RNA polymerase sigma-70 factor (ECF subfamily)